MYASYIPQVAEKMSCLLPQFKCLPDSFSIQFKTHNHSSPHLPKCREPICFQTRCVLSTTAPPVSTESTVLSLEKLQLSVSSTAGILDMEKFHLPSLEAHSNSVAASRPWTYSGALSPPVEGDVGTSLPSEFLTSEDAVITAAAAEAVALAKAAVKVAKDAAAMVGDSSPVTGDIKITPSLSEVNNYPSEILPQDLVKQSDEFEPTSEELELIEAQLSASIAVRSRRRTERKEKRTRAAEIAAANVVSLTPASARPKKRAPVREVDFSDPLRYLRGTTNGNKLLTAREERDLSQGIQELLKLEKIREELTESGGGPPSFAKWADTVGLDKKTLRKRLHHGIFCKDKMIKSNVRLVVSIAKKYQGAGMHLEDLVQEGCRGLVRGAEKFDASKGFKFSTYAHWWIKQAVRKSLSDQSRTIRLPLHIVEASYKLREARRQLTAANGRQPNNEEVAEAAGVTMKRLAAVMLTPKTPRSLDQKIGINESIKPSDVIADPNAMTSDQTLMQRLMVEELDKLLNTLNPREKQVVSWRYGLDDGRMKTLQEIGQMMGISRERVRQIESSGFRKLKSKKKIKHLQQFVQPHWF